MNVDFWLFTTDSNNNLANASTLPTVKFSAGVTSVSVVATTTGVYSVRAVKSDDNEVAVIVFEWVVDTITYTQQFTISTRSDLDVNVISLTTDAISSLTSRVAVAIGLVNDVSVSSTELTAFAGESIEQSIVAYEADGVTPLDLSGKTFVLVFNTLTGASLGVIENADIAITGDNNNIVTFTYPSTATLNVGKKIWSLREDNAASKVYLNGTLIVKQSATE